MTALALSRSFAGAFLDLLAPPACAACGEPLATARPLCTGCEVGLCECDPAECATCGAAAGPSGLCRVCLARRAPLAAVRCAFAHDGPVQTALHRFKYRGRDDLAAGLASLLARAPLPPLPPGSVVVPVPLHARRLRERGYDQALLLARGLARARGLPLAPRLLRRVRETRPQVGLDRAGREENVRHAFAAQPAEGRRVLLVDDVLTTGATLREAARALVAAGAARVMAVTLARAGT